ncbi:hypothetical protein [Microbacterium rhizomatis]|uniref:Uncharacterized protein n=1 Tax=Microbacterium rhizomatis TaxID=1631477 RepID=A0A5J5IY88_9MICO|nr:hypothetical protein [Microbacterium rhizomatis]KAA9105946.1 hypothetical protein F6B43_16425 [Microbacterium rhizomatis]
MRKRFWIAGGAAAGAALSIGASVLIATSAASAGVLPLSVLYAGSAASVADESVYAEMGDGGIDVSSLVEVASDDVGDHLVGLDAAGNVCLITTIRATGLTASSCTDPEVFKETGVPLSIGSRLDSGEFVTSESYLLPDAVVLENSVLVDAGLTAVTPNLLIGDTSGLPSESLNVGTQDGEPFELLLVSDK